MKLFFFNSNTKLRFIAVNYLLFVGSTQMPEFNRRIKNLVNQLMHQLRNIEQDINQGGVKLPVKKKLSPNILISLRKNLSI